MAIDSIKNKLTQAISIKSDMLAAFSSRGLPVTSSTPFAQFPSLIMDIHDSVQAKEAFPRAEGVVVTPDAGYTALTQVTIPSEPNLAADNIVAGKSIYGVQGVAVVENPVVAFLENRSFEVNDPDGDIHAIQTFSNNTYLTTVNLPGITTIPTYMFANCYALHTVSLPGVTNIPTFAFSACSMLETLVLGSASISVASYAFQNCGAFDPGFMVSRLTFVGLQAFVGTLLSTFIPLYSVDIPSYLYSGTQLSEIPSEYQSTIQRVGTNAFTRTPLSIVSLPNVSVVETYAFQECRNIQKVSLPNCGVLSQSAFYRCDQISNIFLSNLSSVGSYAFVMCTGITTAYLGCSSAQTSEMLYSAVFSSCSALWSVTFEGPWIFSRSANNVFYGCGSLYNIHLRHSSVMGLSYSSMFNNCPIGARRASAHIYVPASLVSEYQAANQWSYFASLFTAEEE